MKKMIFSWMLLLGAVTANATEMVETVTVKDAQAPFMAVLKMNFTVNQFKGDWNVNCFPGQTGLNFNDKKLEISDSACVKLVELLIENTKASGSYSISLDISDDKEVKRISYSRN
ncbi:MAG: hypothetical protein KA715_03845 [Xanthomonadaceae bacterium]|nr:hypothetical protein [Xanthomonadaceae bacterium]